MSDPVMRILHSREDWLAARKNFIGGSDAAAVLGLNPYKTNLELWQEKTGLVQPEDISGKPYVQYGHAAESYLRNLFALDFPEYEVGYTENNLWLNNAFPFAHASLDGWLTDQDGRKGILEIKTTNILQSMQKEKWDHRIPDNYYIQVLHYLMVTEFDFAVLKAQLKYEFQGGDIMLQTKHYKIERAEVQEDIAYLMQKESDFWKSVQAKKKPALLLPEI